jgi:hypothetical protein
MIRKIQDNVNIGYYPCDPSHTIMNEERIAADTIGELNGSLIVSSFGCKISSLYLENPLDENSDYLIVLK